MLLNIWMCRNLSVISPWPNFLLILWLRLESRLMVEGRDINSFGKTGILILSYIWSRAWTSITIAIVRLFNPFYLGSWAKFLFGVTSRSFWMYGWDLWTSENRVCLSFLHMFETLIKIVLPWPKISRSFYCFYLWWSWSLPFQNTFWFWFADAIINIVLSWSKSQD